MRGPLVEMPLLTGELARETRASVDDIATALLAIDPASVASVSLGSGTAGLALFHSAYARYAGSEEHEARAQALVDWSVAGLQSAEPLLGSGLYAGLAGVASVLGQLCDLDDDALDPVDDALLESTSRGPFADGYDLIAGLAGIGVYAIRRRRLAAGHELLRQTVERLLELATELPEGIAWEWDRAWSPDAVRGARVAGEMDLGVAHGVAGVLPILAAASTLLRETAVRRAYEGARDWLLSHDLRLESATYPAILSPARARVPARHAWCYGDVGMAAALYAAAQWADDGALEDHACAVAERATRRPTESAGFVDAALCHGTSGVAHVYSLLYRRTGRSVLGDHATKLFAETIRIRVPGQGMGGYLAYEPLSEPRFHARAGLLEGAAGIGLAQVSALGAVAPSWDDLLGIVLPAPDDLLRAD